MRSPSTREAQLPDDFPQRVIAQARREQHQRRVRYRLAEAACTILIVALIPLSRALDMRRHQVDPRNALIAWQDDSFADPSAQLAAATSPDDVGDYLMPNATRVSNFAHNYADAPWQYDPDWTDRS